MYLRRAISNGQVALVLIGSESNNADMGTKPLLPHTKDAVIHVVTFYHMSNPIDSNHCSNRLQNKNTSVDKFNQSRARQTFSSS